MPSHFPREVIDYATDVTDHATRYVETMRLAAVGRTEREVAQLNIDSQRRREEARVALERFFVTATLPVLDARFSMRLHGMGKDAFHEVSVVETHPLGIICALLLDASAIPEWRHPRRIGEFVPGLELMVGAKRSWFNKKVEREVLRLDELIVSGFELDDDHAEIRLRKRLEQKDDSLVFSIRRTEQELFAEARHPDDAERERAVQSVSRRKAVVNLTSVIGRRCKADQREYPAISTGSSTVVDVPNSPPAAIR